MPSERFPLTSSTLIAMRSIFTYIFHLRKSKSFESVHLILFASFGKKRKSFAKVSFWKLCDNIDWDLNLIFWMEKKLFFCVEIKNFICLKSFLFSLSPHHDFVWDFFGSLFPLNGSKEKFFLREMEAIRFSRSLKWKTEWGSEVEIWWNAKNVFYRCASLGVSTKTIVCSKKEREKKRAWRWFTLLRLETDKNRDFKRKTKNRKTGSSSERDRRKSYVAKKIR